MTYSPKEVLFLNEAEEILEMIQVPDVVLIVVVVLVVEAEEMIQER